MANDFKVILEAMIDNSSLTNVQKQLAKERLKINADISVEDFAKSKQEIEKQIGNLATNIKNILGNAVSDKQASQWAKQYYDNMISGAKQAAKEQEKLNEAQKKNTLAEQSKYYQRIIENNKTIYSLKNKLLTADTEQTAEIKKQIKALEQRNKYNSEQLSKKGLIDNSWEQNVNGSKNALENQLKINTAKQTDIKNTNAVAQAEKERISLIDDLAKSYQSIQNLEIKKNNLDTSKDANEIAELDKQIVQATNDYKSLLASVSKNANFDLSTWNKTKTAIDAATQSQKDYNNAKQKDADAIQALKESTSLVNDLAKSYQSIKNLQIEKSKLDVSEDADKIDILNAKIAQAKKEYSTLFSSASKNSNFDSTAWSEEKKAIDAATNSKIKYNNIQKQSELDSSVNKEIESLTDLKAKWEEQGILVGEFKIKVEQLEASLGTVGNKGELNGLKSQIQTLKTEASQLAEIKNIQFSIDNGYGASEYQNQIDKTINSLKQYGAEAQVIEKINTDLQSTFNSMKGLSGQELIDQATILKQKLDAAKVSIDEAKQSYDKFLQPVSGEKITSLILRIQNFLSKNTSITKSARTELVNYIDELKGGNISLEKWNQISNKLKETENEMRVLGKLGKAFKDQWSQAVSSFSTWLSASAVVMKAVSETKEAISELKEVDTYLTEISKANDALSKSDLVQIGNNAFETASKYGKTATDYLAGVQEMSRAGYENADSMAELSVAAQGAGDMTAELANQYIIATDVAFKMNGSIKALTETLDGANSITNHNAVNMTELAEGMSVVGSQAASSQMKVNEITAAIGTMVAVTQKSGSEMGNAFKGILMNLQQVSGDVGDGEDIIDSDSLTKYEAACAELGVSLKEVKNGVVSLKEPMQILKELSKEYTKLDESDAKRANLLSAVGGKYRANALNAILENYALYEKMLQDYADGAGSMATEAEKTANSWEGSLNRISNTWTDTVGHIVNSDAIITIINSLNILLGLINNLTDALGSLGSIGLGAGIFAGFKNVGGDKMYSPFVLKVPTIICVL